MNNIKITKIHTGKINKYLNHDNVMKYLIPF